MNISIGVLQPSALAALIACALLVLAALFALRAAGVERRRLQRTNDELAAANRRNVAIVEASGEGVLELDHVGLVRYANPAAAKLLGYDAEELPGLDYRVLINTQEDDRTDPVRKVRYTTDVLRGVGALLRRKDGQYRPVEYRIVPVTEGGTSVGTVLTFRDVSERVRLDNLLRDMQTTARIGGWEYNVHTHKMHWTDALFAICELPLGYRLDIVEGRRFIDAADLPQLIAAGQAAIETGQAADLELRITSAQGRQLSVRVIVNVERRAGKTVRLHGTVQDVTDRVVAERQVRETRDFYELTLDAMPTMVTYANTDLIVTYANKAVEEWTGSRREEYIGKHLREVMTAELFAASQEYISAALHGQSSIMTQSGVRNGKARDWQSHFVPEITPAGRVRGFFCILYDLTESKRLEARLMQAQKMEAIGQLTGGIAHDFNNLLGVILGNLQLLERSLAETPNLSRKVHTAMRAAVRGADLTRRLLTFARRQILDPTVIDLNRQLVGLADLMQRTLGDSIEVHMVQAHDLWHTRADAGQLENAILNLAINARDAMPQGGRLTVCTKNVTLDSVFCTDHPEIEPGDYVSISVSDTGTGITAEILKRVFEPFFTTKESGKGSGLGLAMVHGFAEQSGGLATIESEPGRGTMVQILLPRCLDAQIDREDTIVTQAAPGGTETILVVEDDADLRETVVTTLSQLGYRALAASNADTALRILRGAEPIDLLFTDIMMPGGMLGPALARRARELRPKIDVLYTTGYADTTILGGAAGVSPSDVIFKPYRNEELATRVRNVLDREIRVA